MPTNYPGAIDAIARPSGSTLRNAPGLELSTRIDSLADAIEAVEAKLGIGASLPNVAGVLRRTSGTSTAWGQVLNADLGAGIVGNAQMAADAIVNVNVASTAAIYGSKVALAAAGARKTTAQSCASGGGATALTFTDGDTLTLTPSGLSAIHSSSSNPTRWTNPFPATALALVLACVAINTAYTNSILLTFSRNGGAALGNVQPVTQVHVTGTGAAGSSWTQVLMIGLGTMTSGQYGELQISHFAGSAANVGDYGNYATQMFIAFLGGG